VERSATVVQRYGTGSVEYTGDKVMALFGAPVALEDHAFRACLAALAIKQEANRLADEVPPRWRGAAVAGGPEFGLGDRRARSGHLFPIS
jgi:class 3 adenylate cyclase